MIDRIIPIGMPTADQLDAMILAADLVASIPITRCGWPAVAAKACLVGKPLLCTRAYGIASRVAASTWIDVPEVEGGALGDVSLSRDHLSEVFRVAIEGWPCDPRLGRMLPSRVPLATEVLETLSDQLSLEGI